VMSWLHRQIRYPGRPHFSRPACGNYVFGP
jgi:hypothetical protein